MTEDDPTPPMLSEVADRPGGSGPSAFFARITPHASVTPRASRIIIAAIIAISVLMQGVFALFGIWLVTTFMFLDTAIVVAGFLAYVRWLDRAEEVEIKNGELSVRRIRAGCDVGIDRIPLAPGLTLRARERRGYGLKALEIRQGETRIELAADLMPVEREAFAEALLEAIRAAGGNVRLDRVREAISP